MQTVTSIQYGASLLARVFGSGPSVCSRICARCATFMQMNTARSMNGTDRRASSQPVLNSTMMVSAGTRTPVYTSVRP